MLMSRIIFIATFIYFLLINSVVAQQTKKVLFLGNSYTDNNNLPNMIASMATNTGDQLIHDRNTPGGYRFLNHANNSTSIAKIQSNNWDYVVLQAQSQEAAFGQSQMQSQLFPYAALLSTLIRQNNACSQPLFYMTWGRQYGDSSNCPSLPWVCNYESMDNVIRSSYEYMADQNDAELAPVGRLWRYLRTNHSTINLYASDNSHPSMAGSYAAACAFYAIVFKKDPTLITWNSSLPAETAQTIRLAAKTVVFDALSTFDYTVNPANANFNKSINGTTLEVYNTSATYDSLFWEFGDGQTSTEINPTHEYAMAGVYQVSLTVTRCGKSHTSTQTVVITDPLNVEDSLLLNRFKVYPNPAIISTNIEFTSLQNSVDLDLYDSRGVLILRKHYQQTAHISIDLNDLSLGVYLLKIATNEGIITKQLVKN